MILLPWGLGVRNARGMRGYSVVVAVSVALMVSLAFGLATVRSTASVTQREVARYAMGEADLLARVGRDDEPPGNQERANLGIDELLVLRNLTTTISSEDASEAVQGRIVEYANPLVEGMAVPINVGTGPHHVALSPGLADSLGVSIGDEVQIAAGNDPVTLSVTDLQAVADLDYPIFFVDPTALAPGELDGITAAASDRDEDRWLISATVSPALLEYLNASGAQVSTESGYESHDAKTLVDLDTILIVVSMIAVGVLAAAIAGLGQERRTQGLTLRALGVSPGRIRRVWMTQTSVVAAPAALVGLVLGWGVAWIGVWVLSDAARQYWGPLEPAWPMAIGGVVVSVLVSILVAGATSPDLEPMPEPKVRTRKVRRRRSTHVIPGLLATRLRRRARRSTAVGLVVIAVTSALGGGMVIVMDVAIQRIETSYDSEIPIGAGAISMPRPLEPGELLRLEAEANSAILEDRAAVSTFDEYGGVPAFLDNSFIQCERRKSFEECSEDGEFIISRTVGIVSDPTIVEGYFGRKLTSEEAQAFLTGDGLLLAGRDALADSEKVTIVNRAYVEDQYSREVHPVVVTGYEPYERVPGLLISPDAAERLGLFLDDTPISWYLLRPTESERITPGTIRAGLPEDMKTVAEVSVENGPPVASYASVSKITMIASCCIAFLVTLLLVSTWANDCHYQFRTLRSLGIGPTRLRQILVLRTFHSLAISVLIALGLSYAGAWGFLTFVDVDVTLGRPQWLLPIAAIVASGLLSSIAFAPVGRPRAR